MSFSIFKFFKPTPTPDPTQRSSLLPDPQIDRDRVNLVKKEYFKMRNFMDWMDWADRFFKDYPDGDDSRTAPKEMYVIYNTVLLLGVGIIVHDKSRRHEDARKIVNKIRMHFDRAYLPLEDIRKTDLDSKIVNILTFFDQFTQEELACNGV